MSPVAKRRRTSTSPERAQSPSHGADDKARKKQLAAQHKNTITAQAVGEMYGSSKSGMFRMETEEMLSEVSLSYGSKRMKAAEDVVRRVKALIDAVPETEAAKIAQIEAQMKKRKIHIPFPEPRPAQDVQYDFAYKKPKFVNVVGSYALKTLVKGKDALGIDLVLTMPEELFSEKDYLNRRYFYKRAYYLSVLAGALAGSDEFKELKLKAEYAFLHGDQLKPILVVSSNGEGCALDSKGTKCIINIIPSAPPGVFPVQKLFPLKNCVRPATDEAAKDPTPFYNASMAAEATYFPYLALLHSSSEKCAAFTEACILGRIWLRQRGFGSAVSSGGFGHFEWAILQAFLLKGGGPKGHGLLAAGYSNYQMFKAMLQFLAARNLVVDPLVLGTSENVKIPGNKTPIVFDGEHAVNVLFKMTSWSYNMLRHEAEHTLESLGNSTQSDQFDSVFLQRLDEPCYKFDAVARFPFPSEAELQNQEAAGSEISGRKVQYAERVYKVLKEGLSDRVSLIHLTYGGEKPFSIKGQKSAPEASDITVGLLLNAQNIARTIDRGPSPEEKKKAAAFRKFWGSKAELRRFPDGSIIESVTWTAKSKAPIYQQIIRYVLSTHFSEAIAQQLIFVGDAFNHLLEGGEQGATLFQPVYDAFDTLDKDIKSITDIPLAIRHISAAAPALRAASIDLPFAPSHPLMSPADVVVQFESSGRWPADLIAIQKTKASFLLRMGQLLEALKPGEVITRVGLENEEAPIMNYAFLEVIYTQTGASFRVRIYHDREASLLENRCNSPHLSPREKEAAETALHEHRKTFVLGPRHTDVVRQLCHRYPLLSPTIRLLKKWAEAHMMAGHVPEELLELLAVRTFMYPFPYAQPASVMAGFLRSLQWLAKWDWRAEPLVLDFSAELKGEELSRLRDGFEKARKKDPALHHSSLWVASNQDSESLWTRGNKPAKVVAARLTALARAADAAVKSAGLGLEPQRLFVPATKEFDFVVQLSPKWLSAKKRKKEKEQSQFKNLQLEEEEEGISPEEIARLGFEPARDFVHEISNLYQTSLILFPSYTSGIVGGVWVPTNPRKWKANVGFSSLPMPKEEDEEGELTVGLNKPALLNEIARIGGELVKGITVNRG